VARFANGALRHFKPLQRPRRDHCEQMAVGPEESLYERPVRRPAFAVVVRDELHRSERADVVQGQLAVTVPGLDGSLVDGRAVDLAEVEEMRIVPRSSGIRRSGTNEAPSIMRSPRRMLTAAITPSSAPGRGL
jgi:hypothetical protein